MADFSGSALENVKTKDLGEVGDMLSDVVTQLKGFDEEDCTSLIWGAVWIDTILVSSRSCSFFSKRSQRASRSLAACASTNANLISTLDEVMKIQADGREKRRVAEEEMRVMENDLKASDTSLCARAACSAWVTPSASTIWLFQSGMVLRNPVMKWMKFKIKTVVEAEDIIISELYDRGLEGAQIEDKVPLSPLENHINNTALRLLRALNSGNLEYFCVFLQKLIRHIS